MAMKVLLINPPRDHSVYSEVPTTVNAEINTMPPLGLLYLEAYLHAHSDHEVKIVDALAERYTYEMLEDIIRKEAPHVVGTTGHTHDLVDIMAVTRLAKKVHPEISVWWGGPHVSDFPKESMHHAEVDGCIPFEGEEAFCEVLDRLARGLEPSDVKGVYYRKNGEVIYTGPRPVIRDLDGLPHPRRHVLDYTKYYYVLGSEHIATSMITSRGCPYNCSFCNTPGRGTWRYRTARSVVDEMEECARLGIREIYMVDDTFNVRKERVFEICQEINRRNLKVSWNCRARVNIVTPELMEALKKAGCTRVHVGVEAGTEEGMRVLNKALNLEKVRKGMEIMKKSGITTLCYFMIGNPHEKTRDDIMRTIDFAISLDPDYVLFGVLTPYPKTAIYDEGVRRGILDPNHWRNFILDPKPGFTPQVWTEWMTEEELREMGEIAFKKFYLRPKQLFRKLMEIRNLKDLARKLKAGWEIAKL
jgi:radical SAM superfamily enzyme YgiQ (UPF0313 family)